MGFILGFNLLKMERLLYRIQTALESCAMWCVVKFFFFFSLSLLFFVFIYFFFCGGGGGRGELCFVETLRRMKCTYALMPS